MTRLLGGRVSSDRKWGGGRENWVIVRPGSQHYSVKSHLHTKDAVVRFPTFLFKPWGFTKQQHFLNWLINN